MRPFLAEPQEELRGSPKKKKRETKSVGENVEKLELWHIVSGNVNWCSHHEKRMMDVP